MVELANVSAEPLARILVHAGHPETETDHAEHILDWCAWEQTAMSLGDLIVEQIQQDPKFGMQEIKAFADRPDVAGFPELDPIHTFVQGICIPDEEQITALDDYLYHAPVDAPNAVSPPAAGYTCCAEPGCVADFECDAMSKPGTVCIPGQK